MRLNAPLGSRARHRRKHQPVDPARACSDDRSPLSVPADARAIPRPRGTVRGGRRPEVVLVHLLPVPRPGLDEFDGGRRTARRSRRWRSATTLAPGLLAYRGWPRRRLGEPRAARGLRAADLLEDPGAGRRHAGLVDRLLRRVASGARPGRGAARSSTPPSTTPGSTARRPWRPIRSTRADGRVPPANAYHGTLSMFERGRVRGRRAAAVERLDAGPPDRPARTRPARTA